MIFHKACRHKVVMNLSNMYMVKSPGITITPKGVSPGMIEIDYAAKKAGNSFACTDCGEVFVTKADIEEKLFAVCEICQKEKKPSELFVTEYVTIICEDCIKGTSTKRPDSVENRYYAFYGEVLKRGEHPTLLAVLQKKN